VDARLIEGIVAEVGVERFFPLQRSALESLLAEPHRDACISARTGSGKTLMYVIPLVHGLSARIVVRLRGLVIVPSRDLAEQVFRVLTQLAGTVDLRVSVAAGLRTVREEMDHLTAHYVDENGTRKAESKSDILVATPGRLVDHIERGLDLQHLQTLVVDEADRLLSQAYQDWLECVYAAAHQQGKGVVEFDRVSVRIAEVTSRRRGLGEEQEGLSVVDGGRLAPRLQRVVCSATLTKNPQKLAALAMERPIVVSEDETASALPRTLEEQVFWVTRTSKPATLLFLVLERVHGRVLIFCSSVTRAQRVHAFLQSALAAASSAASLTCALLSSQAAIKERMRVLEQFRNNEVRALVASDVAARGIDVDNLECVISYDCPHKAKTYVHRAGRTARATRKGLSVVLCRKDQARHFRAIKAKLGAPAPLFTKLDADELAKFQPAVDAFTAAEPADGAESAAEDD